MTLFSEHPFATTTPEPLPMEFEPALERIDNLIGQAVERELQVVSSRIADRTFQATVSMLPSSIDRADDAPLYRLVFSGMSWSRLAMAALVALAFGIGALMMHTSSFNSHDAGALARRGETKRDASDDHLRPVLDQSPPSASFAAWEIAAVTTSAAPGSVDEASDKVAYLLEANTLTSPDDVRYDMAQLLASLE